MTGHGRGGDIVPNGVLAAGPEKQVRERPCQHCGKDGGVACTPAGEHLARYWGAYYGGCLTELQATVARDSATPLRVWVAQWRPVPRPGVLTITDGGGYTWLTCQTASPAAGEAAFSALLGSKGWHTVPGSVWHDSGRGRWERHVYPESAAAEDEMRARLARV